MGLRNGFTKAASLVVGLVLAAVLVPASEARAAAAVDPLPFATTRAIIVDPGTGRVFVAGDDSVAVLEPDGTPITTIPNVPGAYGMDATQGSIWVNESAAGKIARIDPVSMKVVKTYDVGTNLHDDLTIVGNVAWFGRRVPEGGVGRFDLTTSSYQAVGRNYYPATGRIGASTSQLLVYEQGISNGGMGRYATTPTFDLLAWGEAQGYLGNAVANADGTRVFSTGDSDAFQEFDGTTLANTGVKYPVGRWPKRVAWSGAHGGMLVGISDEAVWVYGTGTSAPIASLPRGESTSITDLAISPDGDTAYVLAGPPGTLAVRVVDLRPAATARTPSSAVSGVPTTIEVTGRALGGTTTVTVGGIAVEPTSVAPGRVTFETPAALPTGTHAVVLSGPTGSATTSITLTAGTGAVLTGTVRIGTAPGGSVLLTLSGGGLDAPRSTTSTADGGYAFEAVGAGGGYTLTVHDPSDIAPDQVVRNLGLLPNLTTTLDIDLARPRPNGAQLARTDLGASPVRDLTIDPGTGRVIVAGGDEVDILDAGGRLLARIRGMYGARSLSQVGDDVYVGLQNAGRIVRIHVPTASISGSWPLGHVTTGSIAAAGGKIWFVDRDDQWTHLRALDPSTGAIGAKTPESYWAPSLRSVQGSPDRFIASEATEASVLDGSGPIATPIVHAYSSSSTPTAPFTTSGTGRIFDAGGRRFRTSDLTPDGVRHPGTGPAAYSSGHGGLVAIGGTVSTEADPIATHAFAGAWTATGLDPSGTRLYTTLGDELVVHDLAPHIDSTEPDPHYPDRPITIAGTGLGGTQLLTIDGAETPFTTVGTDQVVVDPDALPPGIHRVRITTPWGTSAPAPLQVLAPRVPGAPTGVAVNGGVTSVAITWLAPTDDGGGPITGYEVTAAPGERTCATTGAQTCTIEGLTPGTSYTFQVRAQTDRGTGPASAPSVSVRMPSAPGAPTGVGASAGGSRASVGWTPPVDTGGLPITSYRVCWSTDPTVDPAGASCAATTSSSTSLVVPDLVPGTTYYFSAATTTAAGTGAPSAPSVGVTPFTVPGAPTDLVATPDRRSAHLSWTAPTIDGGAPITGYVYCFSTEAGMTGATCWRTFSPSTSVTVSSLRGGATYFFTVAAANWAGQGPASAVASATTLRSTPAAPRWVLAVSSPGAVLVSWSDGDDGGYPILAYRACASADPSMAGAVCSTVEGPGSATLTGLPLGIAHYVTVAAVNELGEGTASARSPAATPFTTPGAPVGVTATVSSSMAAIQWTAPANNGGAPLSGYVVTPYIGGAAQPPRTFSSTQTQQVITDLSNSVTYTFRVQAVNGAGTGPRSAPSPTVTPTGPPGPPTPFSSWDAFVARQRVDFTGSGGTASSRAADVAKLNAGETTPAGYIAGLIDHPSYGPAVAPTARLYWAYFGRIPDHSGLEYWARQRRSGTTLIRISASFAGSKEFLRTYGSLSNGAFVDLVYDNVLGRDPDAAGRSYWIQKLNAGTSRGQVMITFSESNEYVRKMARSVGVVEIYAALLDRSPSVAELGAWTDQLTTTLIDAVRLGEEYADRVR